MRVLPLIAVLLLVPAAGCVENGQTTGSEQVAFEDIDKGANSGIEDRRTVVVRSQNEWAQLWQEHTSRVLPPPSAPQVDFQREMVLAVFKGTSPNGCHAAEIQAVVHDDEEDEVHVEGRWIDGVRDAFCTEQITQPYHIVRLERLDGEVHFDMTAVVLDAPA